MRSDGERYRILYEDRDVLVVYKGAGVAVQSARVTVPDVMSMLEGELVKREGLRIGWISRWRGFFWWGGVRGLRRS